MTPYEFGKRAAIKLAVSPEAYNASGTVGALGGAVAGGAAGGYAGGQLGNQISHLTRTKLLGVPIPFTGVGEHVFGPDTGEIAGQFLGGAGGAAVGGEMGYHGGHLAATRSGGPLQHPPQPVQGGSIDPRLLAYLMQQQAQ